MFKRGLYFCEESKCHLFWRDYGKSKVALIEIPDDARVYVENDKFKANKLTIMEIIDFKNISDNFWINILQKDNRALKYVQEQMEEICKLIVQKDGKALKYVKEQFQTAEICKLAIQNNGFALQFVIKQTDQLCKLAVQQNNFAAQFIKSKPERYVNFLFNKIIQLYDS